MTQAETSRAHDAADPAVATGSSSLSGRIPTTLLFFELGLGFSSWAVRIPDVARGLGLDAGSLGVALFALAVGSLLGMPLAGSLAARIGSRPLSAGCGLAFAVALALPGLAGNYVLLCAALVLLGMTNGALGVAMNAQGATLEARSGRHILSSCHGLFSVGGLVGSLLAGAAAGASVPPAVHLGAVAVLLAVVVLAGAARLPAGTPTPGKPVFVRPSLAVLGFGLLAFAVLFCEGAVTDWSAVYLRTSIAAPATIAGLGYTCFATAMALGRLSGDRLLRHVQRATLVRGGGVIALVGSIVALMASTPLVADPVIAFVGYAVLGLGASVVFPNAIAGSAERQREHPDAAIAAVSTVGYAGFLLGPPLIGVLAQLTSLTTALVTMPVCAALIIVLAGAVRAAPRP